MEIEKAYEQWTTSPYFDKETQAELLAIRDNEAEIRDRFYKELEFGTAGIRSVIGAGTNRINRYVVRRVSIGIAKMLVSRGEKAMRTGVVIGYDSRNFSLAFAREAAAVFAGYDINVFLHPDITPVPVLSYSVRQMRCELGIMITASHNPKEYNGYKVYGRDGAQIPPEDSAFVTEEINKITDYTKMPAFNFEFLQRKNKIKTVKESVYREYLQAVKRLIVNDEIVRKHASSLKLVYTPLYGAGAKWVPKLLGELGFSQLRVVEEQMIPDGNFPTVRVPNPEDRGAYDLAVGIAEESGANLILATDPDSDRTGAFVRSEDGEYVMLSGNQIGALLLEYILSEKSKKTDALKNGFVVSTIVSSTLAQAICEHYGVEFIQVLTGFKFIGEQIVLLQEQGDRKFLFGFEESYGYLAGSYCRDKDGVAACMLLAEAACYYNMKNMTLLNAVEELYKQYGYYADMQVSLELKGEQGVEKSAELMQSLRAKKGDVLDGIVKFRDIGASVEIDCVSGETKPLALPKSNVLHYTLADGWFAIRPSGTEPKIKFYFGFRSEAGMQEARDRAEAVKDSLMRTVKELLGA